MYRWNDLDGNDTPSNAELTRVAAVGAGTAGSSIDGGLHRPTTREFRIGVEHSIGSWRWSITGLDRREDDLTAVVNTGVTAQDYTVSYVDDPGIDVEGRSGDALLPIYDRQPASFGLDRYLLTNATGEPSRYQGVEIVLSKDAGDHWYFRFGYSVSRRERRRESRLSPGRERSGAARRGLYESERGDLRARAELLRSRVRDEVSAPTPAPGCSAPRSSPVIRTVSPLPGWWLRRP